MTIEELQSQVRYLQGRIEELQEMEDKLKEKIYGDVLNELDMLQATVTALQSMVTMLQSKVTAINSHYNITTFANGWVKNTTYGSGGVTRAGNLCTLSIAVSNPLGNKGGTTITTLPIGYRPLKTISVPIVTPNGMYELNILSTGVVVLPDMENANTQCNLQVTYAIN